MNKTDWVSKEFSGSPKEQGRSRRELLQERGRRWWDQVLALVVGGVVLTAAVVGGTHWALHRMAMRSAQMAAKAGIRSVVQFWAQMFVLARTAAISLQSGPVDRARLASVARPLLQASPDVVAVSYGTQAWESAVVRGEEAPGAPWRQGVELGSDRFLAPALRRLWQTRQLTLAGPMPFGANRSGFAVLVPMADRRGGPGVLGVWVPMDPFLEWTGIRQPAQAGPNEPLVRLVLGMPGNQWYLLRGAKSLPVQRAAHATVSIAGITFGCDAAWPSIGWGGILVAEAVLGLLGTAWIGLWRWERVRRREEQLRALRAEAEQTRARRKFGALVEAIPQPCLLCKPDGRIVLANGLMDSLVGVSRRRLLGRPIRDLVRFAETVPEPVPLGEHRAWLILAQSGEELRVDWKASQLAPEEIKEELICVVITPAAEEIDVEGERRRAAEEALERFVAIHPEPVLVLREERILHANRAAAGLFGTQRPEDLIGRSILDWAPATQPEDGPSEEWWRQGIRHAQQRGRWFPFLFQISRVGKPCEVSVIPWRRESLDEVMVLIHPVLPDWQRMTRWLQEAFQSMMERSPNGEIWLDLEGKIRWVNPAFGEILGWEKAEFADPEAFLTERVHPEDRPRWEEVLERVQGLEPVGSTLLRLQRRDGGIVPVEIQWHPICDRDGRPVGIRLVLHPIREPRETAVEKEDLLSGKPASEGVSWREWRDLLLDLLDAGMREIDLESGRIEWDSKWLAMFDLDPEELATDPEVWKLRVLEEDRDAVTEKMEKIYQEGWEGVLHYRIVRMDGEIRRVEEHIRQIRGPDGRPRYVLCVARFLPEEEKEEEPPSPSAAKLLASRAWHQVLDIVSTDVEAPIWIQDEEGRLVFANEPWGALIGRSVGELLGKRPMEWSEAAGQLFTQWMEKARSGPGPHSVFGELQTDGRKLKLSCLIWGIQEEEGQFVGLVGRVVAVAGEETDQSEASRSSSSASASGATKSSPSQAAKDERANRKRSRASSEKSAWRQTAPKRGGSVQDRSAKAKEDHAKPSSRETKLSKEPKTDQIPDKSTSSSPREAESIGWDLAEAAELLGISQDELQKRVAEFVQRAPRLLARIEQTVQSGLAEELWTAAGELADLAGGIEAEELRRLARTVRLAVEREEGDITALAAELIRAGRAWVQFLKHRLL